MLYASSSLKQRRFAGWVNRRLYKVCSWRDYEKSRETDTDFEQAALPFEVGF